MHPDQLHAFLLIHRTGSYTRAAEALRVTQPAVTRQIQRLEQELGVTLFERIGRRTVSTEAAQAIVPEAERVVGDLERLIEVARRSREPGQGRLRIGASTTPGLYLLPHILARFRERFPDVDLHFEIESSLSIERKIVRNELDLGFVGALLSDETLLLEPVLRDRIVCIASQRHPWAARRRGLKPSALEGARWVMREEGSATRRLFEQWLREQGVRLDSWIEVGSPEAVKLLVRAGLGLGCLSSQALRGQAGVDRLRQLPVTGLPLERPIYLARHRDKALSPDAGAFVDLARRAWRRR